MLRGSLLIWLATARADNIWALQGWCKKRFEGNEASMDAFFKEVRVQSIHVTSEKVALHAGCKLVSVVAERRDRGHGLHHVT